jgi:hypothetical protein
MHAFTLEQQGIAAVLPKAGIGESRSYRRLACGELTGIDRGGDLLRRSGVRRRANGQEQRDEGGRKAVGECPRPALPLKTSRLHRVFPDGLTPGCCVTRWQMFVNNLCFQENYMESLFQSSMLRFPGRRAQALGLPMHG